MKTINIYLASNEELKKDKTTIGNLVRKLDDNYSKRGVRIKLVDSDDFIDDDEKLSDFLKGSQMFVALFHKTADSVSIEEFDNALDELKKKNFPKVYVYCRDLVGYDAESPELVDFKKKLYDELGYYWCRYGNEDTLQLNFIMQIQHIETDCNVKLEVKDGVVKIGNEEVANLANVPFIANNVDFQENKKKVFEIEGRIERLRIKVEKYPDDEDFRNELDELLPKYKELKKNIEKEEEYIFKSALEIAKLQQGIITDQKRRAIEAFERGEVKVANIILKEAILNADEHFEELEKKRQIFEKGKEIGRQYVDDAILNAVIMMADSSIQINERITRADDLYEKACKWAEKSDYEEYKYIELLKAYFDFLQIYAKYDKAFKILSLRQKKVEKINNEFLLFNLYYDFSSWYRQKDELIFAREYAKKSLKYCSNEIEKANVFVLIGDTYNGQFDAGKKYAVQYYEKALEFYNKFDDDYQIEIIRICLSIGFAEFCLKHEEKASECFDFVIKNEKKIKEFIEKVQDDSQEFLLAATYEYLGIAYQMKDMFENSIECLNSSLKIFNSILGNEHPRIGEVCLFLGDSLEKKKSQDALTQYNNALSIFVKHFGDNSVQSASVYDSISKYYLDINCHKEALKYAKKSLSINIKRFGKYSKEVADKYDIISDIYNDNDDFVNAIKYEEKSLAIYLNIKRLGKYSKEVVDGYRDIGEIFIDGIDDPGKALDYYKTALTIINEICVSNSIEISKLYEDIALCYDYLDEYEDALQYNTKALEIKLVEYGYNHEEIARTYNEIAHNYEGIGKYDVALQYFNNSTTILENLGVNNKLLAHTYFYIGRIYEKISEPTSAVNFYTKSLNVLNDLYDDENSPTDWTLENIQDMETYISNNQ